MSNEPRLPQWLRGYSTFVFDCDGVLLDSNHLKSEAFYRAALPHGEAAAHALLLYHWANGGVSRQAKFDYFVRNIIGENPAATDTLRALLDQYSATLNEMLEACDEAPGATRFLDALPSSARAFVVSGGAQDEVRWALSQKNMAHGLDGVFGNPDTKQVILKRLAEGGELTRPGIYFGDAWYDYAVASDNGLDFVFLFGLSESPDWRNWVSDHSIPFYETLEDCLYRG